jgi:hypothetical protein
VTEFVLPLLIFLSIVAGSTALWYSVRSIQKDFERETAARWYERE